MILKLLFNTRMIWIIFIKILKDTILISNAKYCSFFMIWLLVCFVIKKLNPIVTELYIELYIRGRELNISLVFITQCYFAVIKNIRLNSTHYFIVKIPNKGELKEIAFNYSSDIVFRDFMNLYKKCTTKPYFLFIDWCYSCIR